MPTHPEVLWAQRSSSSALEKNTVYLTVNLPDIVESTLKYKLSPTRISFEASVCRTRTDYAFDLDLFANVVPEKSSSKLSSRSFTLVLQKEVLQSEYWPRLTKEKVKTPFIKTDFSRWVDEDEQDGMPSLGDEDFDMGGMGGMGGGMDFEKMMAQMGDNSGAGAGTGTEALEPDSESDDDESPSLEDGEPAES